MKVSEHWAKARVEVSTEAGKWLLMEIRGLKEGTVLTGTLQANWNRFDFPWERYGAMLIPGDNCTILEEEQIEYRVSDPTDFPEDEEYMEQMIFDNLRDAKDYQKKYGGKLDFGASVINADCKNKNYGEYIIEPLWKADRDEARKALREQINRQNHG